MPHLRVRGLRYESFCIPKGTHMYRYTPYSYLNGWGERCPVVWFKTLEEAEKAAEHDKSIGLKIFEIERVDGDD